MTETPPDGVETPRDDADSSSPQPESTPPPPQQEETTDWRVVVIIGVAALLLLAAFVNRKFYGKKAPEGPTAAEPPAAREPQQRPPTGPTLSPAEQYRRLLAKYRAELLGTLFVVEGKQMLLARPPLVATSDENAPGDVQYKPGILFDVSNRVEGVAPTDFQRRGFFNMPGLAFMESFPSLRLDDSVKLVVKPAVEVSLDVVADNHVVIGVVAGEESRAYPLRLVNHHEVINDTLGGKPIVVCWSALALSGEAFDRTAAEGSDRVFGSAGLMHQGVIVMYDEKTRSLWSPSRRQCLAGESAGAVLSPLPAYLTTWKEWRRLHPETTALVGTDPVLNINYDSNPAVPPNYYGPSPAVLHPVAGLDIATTPMPLKARVFGIALPDGRARAYAMVLLEELKEPTSDTFGEMRVLLDYDSEANVLRATTGDGAALPVETMFWIAWQGAHPDTEIWQEERVREMMNPKAPSAGPTVDTNTVLPESVVPVSQPEADAAL
jgi:hypothetical protein